MKKHVLVTGSGGLVGSESVKFFARMGYTVHGIDNNMRKVFFGSAGSTRRNQELLIKSYRNYTHHAFDIRNRKKIQDLFDEYRFDLIIHTAAQPSHDWAARDPLTDFSINAVATLILLEAYRKHCPRAVFIFTSTNKVYGDRPNTLPLVERAARFELPRGHAYFRGIDETMSIDNSLHSVFGSSKAAADIMVQEYGKYFGLTTAVFRCGCITGPAHAGVPLHGFLAYLVRCIAMGITYTIYGYKGKQVRDNIHAHDLVSAFYHFYKNPKTGEVYNIGGSRHSNTSILEAIGEIEAIIGKKAIISYQKKPRIGDHQWYISDVSKFQKHFPKWKYTYNNDNILQELCLAHSTVC
jgi:CDP-paratose 2-epimerase